MVEMLGQNQCYMWALEIVHYFRPLGFFADWARLSEDQLVTKLLAQRRWIWGFRDFDPSSIQEELGLLSLDKERIWWRDLEANVCAENQVYVTTLQEWSRIARGAFQLEHVQEQWASDEGPITLSLLLDGQPITLHPVFYGDWLDLNILSALNQLIRNRGTQFEVYAAFDQTAYVVLLTKAEKARLQAERGWRFALS
ncbi:MAG: hypothetical protein R3C14_38470 [Caldilineaceae bacterium]